MKPLSISIAGQDYSALSAVEVTLLPEENSTTIQVAIINDEDSEPIVENFFGNLIISPLSSDIAQVSVPQATVNIDDDGERDSKSVLSLTHIII